MGVITQKNLLYAEHAKIPEICKNEHLVKLCIFNTIDVKRICCTSRGMFSGVAKKKKTTRKCLELLSSPDKSYRYELGGPRKIWAGRIL